MPAKSALPVNATSEGSRLLLPTEEQKRLEALESYQVLDSAPDDDALNDLTRLASIICNTPISLVSLVDAERQWFKANLGLEGVTETPLSVSFCRYVVQKPNDLLEVSDATLDPRFQNNPLVLNQPNIRFYAGAPLVNPEGYTLGALCAIDTKPRTLTSEQREALLLLARQVTTHLELRRTKLLLEQEKLKMHGLLQLANDETQALYASGRNEIFVKHEQRLMRVRMADICYIEALGDYVNIYTCSERLTVCTTMKDMEAKLPTKDFTRIQRKYIIRLDCLRAIEGELVQVDGPKGAVYIPIGNSYKTALMNRLNLI
ncbi:GAF domain-containing DNA-binding protein [Hymenobacter sp. J193]|uniref:GAF domain-containing DNA-binding protein n=1 Tax=Hymenobacter sp. J193 TaxID=2898429 RepID=UPI002150A66D|nr:GAF domain-containing DNA-binding protein [Hymenobacter sp. J193]MCR5888501.1 GAF domain-containing DNA-binding protein [Hymenobacter sp. J193]